METQIDIIKDYTKECIKEFNIPLSTFSKITWIPRLSLRNFLNWQWWQKAFYKLCLFWKKENLFTFVAEKYIEMKNKEIEEIELWLSNLLYKDI